ncbi:hypothetical protein M3Y94_00046700 [Aphelenchoides besseyi]|nr:hypothetical protein M3Y94_00046700 [Aphelenchoides besseyi]
MGNQNSNPVEVCECSQCQLTSTPACGCNETNFEIVNVEHLSIPIYHPPLNGEKHSILARLFDVIQLKIRCQKCNREFWVTLQQLRLKETNKLGQRSTILC